MVMFCNHQEILSVTFYNHLLAGQYLFDTIVTKYNFYGAQDCWVAP
jgi:hypothetical protein